MTENLVHTIINCQTGEVEVRPFTAEEIEQYQNDLQSEIAFKEAQELELARQAELKASAVAKLAALGLTEEEASAIIK